MDLPHHASGERDYITMRTLTVVRQYLAAAFLLVIGLIAYGCGDSATVSEPAELGNLSVATGTLQPAFNPATTNYTVELSSNVSSTIITASPRSLATAYGSTTSRQRVRPSHSARQAMRNPSVSSSQIQAPEAVRNPTPSLS